MSISISQFSPLIPSLLVIITFFSIHLQIYFCFANKFICTVLVDSTIGDIIFVFLFLTSFSTTVSRFIHVSASGTFPFHGWVIFHWWLPGSSAVKNPPDNSGDTGLIPGLGRSPGEGNGNHSSILVWKIPWTEESGRLQSMGSQRVGHDLAMKQEQIFCFIDVPYLYPFLCQRTFMLLPCLAIVKCAAVNTRVHASFWIMVFSEYMPRSERN